MLAQAVVRKKAGVCLLEWRNVVCGMMMVIVPTSLMTQDSGRAMLHSDGGVWLNGNPAPGSTAIFLHDLVQTPKGIRAKIDAEGSTATVQPETIVQFNGDELVLDHGSLQVNTSRGMKVRVNCMTVIPVAPEWTRYDVVDLEGKITVVAYEKDVKIHTQGASARRSKAAATSEAIVHQGEQSTREERCGVAASPVNAIDAKGAILNSPWARGAGIAAIGILTCWALCHTDDPISPAKP
jgi:hypothetical protein